VHVLYHSHDASASTYFLAGKPNTTCTNRIVAQVRTSSSRSKADFDKLAEKIDRVWEDVLHGGDGDVGEIFGGEAAGGGAGKEEDGKEEKKKDGGRKKDEESEKEAEAKRLLVSLPIFPLLAWRRCVLLPLGCLGILVVGSKQASMQRPWVVFADSLIAQRRERFSERLTANR
jgi:hypothetical protein